MLAMIREFMGKAKTQPIKIVTTNSLKHDRVMAFEVTD